MQEYPDRLQHRTPSWVESGATFHIRMSIAQGSANLLTDTDIASPLLASARLYHDLRRWHCRLFLLMPDHIHALLVFPYDRSMRSILGSWKGYQTKYLNIAWQVNFFDHRIRNRDELAESEAYIRLNPVRKLLCHHQEDWPWWISCAG